jgi:hypothetical protein
MKRSAICFSLVLSLTCSTSVFAQGLAPRGGATSSKKYAATPLSSALAAAARGDSLKNGTAVGAILGGAGAFAFGMWLCNNLKEEGDPPCWKGSLVLGAAGAGGGALLGAGVDAALTQRTAVRFRIRW